jgi:DNA-binding transcriptional regulator YiaG
VAEEVGTTEDMLKVWEQAVRAKVLPEMEDAVELLKVDANGPVNLDPLAQWQLRFYPDSARWRRTRSHRDEVPRSAVAKKVGVSEEVLAEWEKAMLAIKGPH